jgi:hypothetical protein
MTRHDVTDPDPLCYGDDPCVCEQLIEARRQATREFYGRWKYSKKRGCWIWKWKSRKVKKP